MRQCLDNQQNYKKIIFRRYKNILLYEKLTPIGSNIAKIYLWNIKNIIENIIEYYLATVRLKKISFLEGYRSVFFQTTAVNT